MGLGKGFEHLAGLDSILRPEEVRKLRRRISIEAAKIVRRQARKIYRTGAAEGPALTDLTVRAKQDLPRPSTKLLGHGSGLTPPHLWQTVEVFAANEKQVGNAERWVENGPGFEVLIGTSTSENPIHAVKAAVHEDGQVIPVTDAMRAFFLARFGVRLRPETQFIMIPPRPVYPKALEESVLEIQAAADKAVIETATRGPGPRELKRSELMRVIERLRSMFSGVAASEVRGIRG
jgi:hypothetical protein